MEPGGGQQLQHPGVPGVSARDLFPDGGFVRLQNRAQQTYLASDDDGEGVSLRPHGAAFSPSAVWRAHHVVVGGDTFVLLAVAVAVAPGRRVVQRDYGGADGDVAALMWRPFRMTMVDDDRHILLRHDLDRNLRANGRFCFWRTAVTADVSEARWSTMTQWMVRRFRLAPGLPPLPLPPPIRGARSGTFLQILGARIGLLRRRRPVDDERRTIRHVRANDEGDFDHNSDNWPAFLFYGRSVFNLMTQVRLLLPGGEAGTGITLAVRPGLQGRLTPLVTNLPRSVDTMDIVVFNTGSQGAQNLVFPDIV